MTRRSPLLPLFAVGLTGTLALAGCASGTAAAPTDDTVHVVASTNVYAQIAEAIGGDLVDTTAIVSSAAQDPHSFEPSARDQLSVDRADLIIENGGGYDAFLDALIEASDSTAPVLTAVEFSSEWTGGSAEADDHDHDEGDHADDHDHADEHDHVEGFNEHVWYDPGAMDALAQAIAAELETLRPDDADTISANLATFSDGIAGLQAAVAEIKAADGGADVFATEPVALYLVQAAGLVNVTPDAFIEAVEEGQDVAPSTLLEALKLLRAGDVRAVIVNTQTGGAETAAVVAEAEADSIPVAEFSETLPEGQTYLSWMQANIDALAGALQE